MIIVCVEYQKAVPYSQEIYQLVFHTFRGQWYVAARGENKKLNELSYILKV